MKKLKRNVLDLVEPYNIGLGHLSIRGHLNFFKKNKFQNTKT